MAPALPAAAAAAAHPSSRPLHSIPRFSPHFSRCTAPAGCMHGPRIADLTHGNFHLCKARAHHSKSVSVMPS